MNPQPPRMRPVDELELGLVGPDHACRTRGARRLGVRNRDWQFGIGIQHQLLPRVSLDVTYNRRWWSNFFSTHNARADARRLRRGVDDRSAAPEPARWRRLSGLVSGPQRPPGGWRDRTPIHDRPGLRRRNALLARCGLSFSARLRDALFLQAGTSTGRGVNDTCDVLMARFGSPMAPTTGPVIASGIVNGQPCMRLRRAVADAASRPD